MSHLIAGRSLARAAAASGGVALLLWASACSDSPRRAADAASDAMPATNCPSGRSPDRSYYRDRDGDGFGVPGKDVMHGCGDEPPDGYAINAKDCDDASEDKQLERFRDRDQDGYGEPGTLACVGAAEAGHADQAGDCDDASAARSPKAAEVWLDGIDQDCDGSDELRGCIAAPGQPREAYATSKVIAFPDLSQARVERNAGCQSADLYFVLIGACPVCGGGKSTVVIGNRGTVAAAFRVESNAGSVDVDEPLQPQELAEPLELPLNSPGSEVKISVRGGAADCDLGNNAREVMVGHTDCAGP